MRHAMCLGIPGRVTAIYEEHGILMGNVAFGPISKRACLDHVRGVQLGDYVLVHVGFALSCIDAVEAERLFALLQQLDALQDVQGES